MSTLRNKVSLIGRLGAQPEVVKLESGRTLARFSIATNERYQNNQGEWADRTQWFQITAWGRMADRVADLLNKGQEIVASGRLINSNYETKEGEKRYTTQVELNEFLLIAGKKKDEN